MALNSRRFAEFGEKKASRSKSVAPKMRAIGKWVAPP